MISREIKIINKHGMHTRPATAFVTAASKFKSEIYLEYNGVRVNAKSILGLLVLAVEPGSALLLSADGSDETEAIEALDSLAQNRFNME
ncbi:HPr family phosphocarrier protein [bacterium]|nr:HPr family phosphocarrier protein [bacterium]MBU1064122.1 HPr family phosphocarrier protein [bacterium]MBU1634898.1 HPr family phosphocarrier protein [bacterium]MBU1872659.1 HPr family phosphocarrier protein [bacterium]